jgi:STE24 endopeptidase
MYFIVILAFALVLTDNLPPAGWSLLPLDTGNLAQDAFAARLTLAIAASLVVATGLAALFCNRMALRHADGSERGLDRVQEWHNHGNHVVLVMVPLSLCVLLIGTPWMPLARETWGLGAWPLLAEAVILAPFFASIVLAWTALYPAERIIRREVLQQRVHDGAAARPVWRLGEYLIYKLRHQVFVIAVPMTMILLAKHILDPYRASLNTALRIPWAADAVLGAAACCVLLIAPVMIRLIWATRPLPAGPLREKLVEQCRRIGLRYRNILVWDSQGLIANAAVMGFVSPLRYIMLSDGLLETMSPRQIEAVFGHEAGHVRHHHLPFFLVFAALSMLIVGGVLELLVRLFPVDPQQGWLQLIALVTTLVIWGIGFGWISRRFERQADVFGVRAITPEIELCVPECAVHAARAAYDPGAPATDSPLGPAMAAQTPQHALCRSASQLFSMTLLRVADLNGIPRDAPSWRHGSINSRCRLLQRLADNPRDVLRFDRSLRRIKVALLAATILCAAVALWLYWPAQLLRR